MKTQAIIADCPVGRDAILLDPAETYGSKRTIPEGAMVYVSMQIPYFVQVIYQSKPYIIGNTTLAEWHGNDQDAIQAT